MAAQKKSAIGLVGGGTIGASWAALFTLLGHRTRIYEEQLSIRNEIYNRVERSLAILVKYHWISQRALDAALKRLVITKSLGEAVQAAAYVQESITEDYSAKIAIFREIERFCPADAIIASSSSGLLISKIQTGMQRPSRCLIAHPFNPPHLLPLVELVKGKQTSQKTVDSAYALMKSLGKIPVVLKKEVPGHIANRLAAALWREAIDLVDNGVATVEDVDKALYAGPGLRWAFMGSHLVFHLGGGEGGIEYFLNTLGEKLFPPIWKDMSTWTEIPDTASEKLKKGIGEEVGTQTMEALAAWRDERLMKLLKVLYRDEQ